MLLRTVLSRATRALDKPLLNTQDILAPHSDALHFAERAVKSTSAKPLFFCTKRLLSCQTKNSYAALVTEPLHLLSSSCSEGSTGGLVNMRSQNSLVSLKKPCVRVYLQGNSVLWLFRNNKTSFQCRGDERLQLHEISLLEDDVFALMCPVHRNENVQELFTSAFNQRPCDMEYVAEELLLKIKCPIEGGSTSVVARTAYYRPTGVREPPCSHLNA